MMMMLLLHLLQMDLLKISLTSCRTSLSRGDCQSFMKENINHSHQYIANVKSLEDLMKTSLKNRNYGARRKSRSTVRIIINQSYKMVYSPKATISKKATTRTPSSALSCLPRRRL
ncbi:hypothetical protein F2Q68_00021875 [Brassica cretica]|uniref:Uncharacterized protein n=1 Tax=Brassica cretica TaxID=69181 RepID=A0A8S9G114_BRACR|nr:hypothetical protein F2Q68_00021875 [Brassica cretica]